MTGLHGCRALASAFSCTTGSDVAHRLSHTPVSRTCRARVAQPHSLGLLRSDYMLNRGDSSSRSHALLQVELNTISSSFGPLAQKVGELQR